MNSLGDLAQTFALRARNTELRSAISRLSEELATGQAADLSKHLGGGFVPLSSIERDMRVLDGRLIATSEALQFADAQQAVMTKIHDEINSFSADLITGASASKELQETIFGKSKSGLDAIISSLNTQSAGRSLFAGSSYDQKALIDGDTLISVLQSEIPAASSAQDIKIAIDNWFADPAGFDSIAYLGGDTDLPTPGGTDGQNITFQARADNRAFQDVLKAHAYVAVLEDNTLNVAALDHSYLLEASKALLLSASEKIIYLQAGLGHTQEKLETTSARLAAERSSLNFAKGALISVDPYKTATQLEAAQFRLESLYTVTVRLSQLSLVNFLR